MIDLLTIVPVIFILAPAQWADSEMGQIIAVLKIFRVLRLYRIHRVVCYLESDVQRSVAVMVLNVTQVCCCSNVLDYIYTF